MEEALFLTRFAPRVTLIHRRDEFRASQIMQKRVLAHEKIDVAWNSVVAEVVGDEFVTGVTIADVKTGEKRTIDVEAVFVAIGHLPTTSLFEGKLDLESTGYIAVKPGTTQTSVEGVFACGDVADSVYRQAVTAAGTGCMAAIESERWLAEQESD